jgi:hypothetical protein
MRHRVREGTYEVRIVIVDRKTNATAFGGVDFAVE